MRCPFCQNPCHEETVECSHCGFSLPKLDQYLGSVPKVRKGISDEHGRLRTKERSRVLGAISRLEKKFPQIGFTVLIEKVKPEVPLHLYAFWIFNRSTVCASVSTGAVNRDILLTIDAPGRRASLMIGYGLEPFMSAQHLTDTLEHAREELTAGDFQGAIVAVLERLEAHLQQLHGSLRRTYGAEPAELGIKPENSDMVNRDGSPVY